MSHLTTGTDVELILARGGKFVSAIPIIKGDKKHPEEMECGSLIQHDNVTLEFAIPPTTNEEDWLNKIKTALVNMRKRLPDDLEVLSVASGYFDQSELDHPEAKKFGCEPDFDAWSKSQNNPPCAEATFRSCGGHIHIGAASLSKDAKKWEMVRIMDLVHSMAMLCIDTTPESVERKQLYGKAGCHRPKPYGVEYRTLSNTWISNPELARLIFRLTRDSLSLLESGKGMDMVNEVGADIIVSTVDSGNMMNALTIMENNVMPHLSDDTLDIFESLIDVEITPQVERNWKVA